MSWIKRLYNRMRMELRFRRQRRRARGDDPFIYF